MTQWNKLLLGKQAKELGFVRDAYEKVCVEVLTKINMYQHVSGTGVLTHSIVGTHGDSPLVLL